MRIYYAKKNTPLYFLNITEGEEEINKTKLDSKNKWNPINLPKHQIILLYSVREFHWAKRKFYNQIKGFYIFKHLPTNNLFAINGSSLDSKEEIKDVVFDIYPIYDYLK